MPVLIHMRTPTGQTPTLKVLGPELPAENGNERGIEVDHVTLFR